MTTQNLFDANSTNNPGKWFVLNDGVMGGRSQGDYHTLPGGIIKFSGEISLKNNGGFSSLRYGLPLTYIGDNTHMILKIKGDGKPYQLRIKKDRQHDYSYAAYFETSGDWQEIFLPLADFYPVFRGRRLTIPLFKADSLSEVGFLFGNKKEEKFSILIQSIHLVKKPE